ncbi:uncharacterized protein ARMOST_19767 [Armillaria ostoyae]|uniref:Aldehyde dehydrogenase domain-containing protein n=1 Tax=Armillaria ostoyae TaxID=47428 RepID=A0A284S5G3_ARMOS|nr:uncharacterized protein ARMOST_19767 [Armillaria ostoyae]
MARPMKHLPSLPPPKTNNGAYRPPYASVLALPFEIGSIYPSDIIITAGIDNDTLILITSRSLYHPQMVVSVFTCKPILTLHSTFLIGELFQEAGLPVGVLDLVTISKEYSPVLTVAHRRVCKINFTGSDRIGRIIVGEAAKYISNLTSSSSAERRLQLVLDNADVDAVAKGIVSAVMRMCSLTLKPAFNYDLRHFG